MTTNIKEFPGNPLKESDFEKGNILFTTWTPRAEYAWDAGGLSAATWPN